MNTTTHARSIIWMAFWVWAAALQGVCLGEDFSRKLQAPVSQSIDIRREAQEKADGWAEEKLKLEAEFKILEAERNSMEARMSELKDQVEKHGRSVATLEKNLVEIDRISRELAPFLENLYQRLNAFVENDIPFLSQERRNRMATLRRTLDDAAVSQGEKFRKVMEALYIEAEYGNTVEVYQERIALEAKPVLVNILRLGRLSLLCQTLDGTVSGVFDPGTEGWKTLPADQNRSIGAALDIGSKRKPAEILHLPLGKVAVNE
jgi:hypothetical protein